MMDKVFQGRSDFDAARYTEWREKRINKLVTIVGGKDWFNN